MKTLKFEANEREEWLYTRRGKITGSTLKDIAVSSGVTKEMIVDWLVANNIPFIKTAKKEDLEKLVSPEGMAKLKMAAPKKIGFYDLIAAKLGLPPDDENPMARGSRLEKEAIARFEEENPGIKVDTSLIIWTRDENESIAISPDGIIDVESAIEAKCLSSARHIEAFLTKKIPAEYELQALQYFIVNDELETLHFIFYDPRFLMFSDPDGKQAKIDYFEITVTRAEVQDQIDEMLEYERKVIAEVNAVVNKLSNF